VPKERPRRNAQVINAKLDHFTSWLYGQGHNTPQNRLTRSGYSQPICNPYAESAPSSQANDLYNLVQPLRYLRPRFYKRHQSFHKNLATTGGGIAETFAYLYQEMD
jgi:hypothetical protein